MIVESLDETEDENYLREVTFTDNLVMQRDQTPSEIGVLPD